MQNKINYGMRIFSLACFLLMQFIFLFIIFFTLKAGDEYSGGVFMSVFYGIFVLPLQLPRFLPQVLFEFKYIKLLFIAYLYLIPVIFFFSTIALLLYAWKNKLTKRFLKKITIYHCIGSFLGVTAEIMKFIIFKYGSDYNKYYPSSFGFFNFAFTFFFAIVLMYLFWFIFFKLSNSSDIKN